MKDMVAELKQRYDFVIFDSPPIMGVSDAAILASEWTWSSKSFNTAAIRSR
jgi:Mrp family chromosome partitioning ATPase